MKTLSSLIITLTVLVSSFLVYTRYKELRQPSSTTTQEMLSKASMAVSAATKASVEAKREAVKQSWAIINRPKLATIPALKVGAVITQETQTLLLAREQQTFDTICSWDVAQEKAEKALVLQKEYTVLIEDQAEKNRNTVVLWQIISGAIIIIAIIILI